MNEQPKKLVARSVRFLSEYDEDAFFGWLKRLDCVADYRGEGIDLLITLKSESLDDDSLRELLALFSRYGVAMSQLAAFENDGNRVWFRDVRAYWHAEVFSERRPE